MRAVHSRWQTVGSALLWALAVPLAARNGWCVLQQLGSDLISDWSPKLRFVPMLHTLLMGDRKLELNVLRCSSEVGCLVRETTGALRARDVGDLLGALFWIGLLLAAALAAYVVWTRAGSWASRIPPRARARFGVVGMLVAWAAFVGWLAALGANTNVDYRRDSERHTERRRELKIERLGPGKTFTLKLDLTNPTASASVITFLDGAVDVPQGTRVGTVQFESDDAHSQLDLLAGVDTADFNIDRPESRARRAHSAALDRACFSWRVHDDSSHYYTARAYRTGFEARTSAKSCQVVVTSTLDRGSLAVVMVNVLDPKLPKDPSRRRWLADRW